MQAFKLASSRGGRGAMSRPSAITSGSGCCRHRHALPAATGCMRRPTCDGLCSRAARANIGFTLEEVGTLMALSTHNVRSACAEVRQLAADHLAVVPATLADLQTIEGVLADAVLRYDVDELPGCPLIKTLSEEVSLHN